MPEETHQLELFQYTIATLKDRGFNQYEISNFAHHGYECRHNRLYWLNGEHLGLGAGASSYINGVRSRNIKSPAKYTQSIITETQPPILKRNSLHKNRWGKPDARPSSERRSQYQQLRTAVRNRPHQCIRRHPDQTTGKN